MLKINTKLEISDCSLTEDFSMSKGDTVLGLRYYALGASRFNFNGSRTAGAINKARESTRYLTTPFQHTTCVTMKYTAR